MILFIYNLALLAALAAGAPWWLWRMATARKYREGLSERLGWVPARLAALGRERPLIWLHAVSVGEVLAASRLAGELDRAIPGHRRALRVQPRFLLLTRPALGGALFPQRPPTPAAHPGRDRVLA